MRSTTGAVLTYHVNPRYKSVDARRAFTLPSPPASFDILVSYKTRSSSHWPFGYFNFGAIAVARDDFDRGLIVNLFRRYILLRVTD